MKQFKVKLDKQRTLKLTNRSLRDLELDFGNGEPKTAIDIIGIHKGMNTEDIGVLMLSKLSSINLLSKVIFYALEDDLTKDEVLDIIPMKDSITLGTTCMEMLFDAYGLSDLASEESKLNGQGDGTGKKQKA